MAILTASAFKTETLKILDDIFKHEYRRSKELNAEVHCALPLRDKKIVEESSGQLTEVA
jgi:hypothetical protein